MFLLDALDPGAARRLDNSYGINDTWIVFEAVRRNLQGLGSKGMNLSDSSFLVSLTLGY